MRSINVYALLAAAAVGLLLICSESMAYDRYNDGCQTCHGAFGGGTSPKGTVFPNNDKHRMHRNNNEMNTDCGLCHSSGDGDDPFLGSSDGTNDTTGYGCVGCHGRLEDAGFDGVSAGLGAGLRQHHTSAGSNTCTVCHTDAVLGNFTPAGEQFKPPYYGSVDTDADMSCNPTQAARTNENWSTGEFVGIDNDGDNVYDGSDTDCPPATRTRGDFGYDGRADILWRNGTTGQNWLYKMSGSSIDASQGLGGVATTWAIVGNGDYDGNGTADILWRSTTGQNWINLMVGSRVFSSVPVNTLVGAQWQVVGNGDYNGDSKADILWRNTSSGDNWMYLMDGATISSSMPVNNVGTQWNVVGSGDYNGDGKSDILWFDTGTGTTWMYLMNGPSIVNSLRFIQVDPLEWQVRGSGDYDGDGDSDILWRNSDTGQVWMHQLEGSVITNDVGQITGSTGFSVAVVSDTNWDIVSSGDYDGDGDADVLWRRPGSGENWMHLMNGPTITSSVPVNIVGGTQWQVVSTN